MLKYEELINWAKEKTDLDINKVNNTSEPLLKLCLINNKFDYLELFDSRVWNKENIDLYLDKLDIKGQPVNIQFNYNNADSEIYYVSKLLNKGFFDVCLQYYYYSFKNEEIYKILFNNIGKANIKLHLFEEKLSYFMNPDMTKELIKTGRYDFLLLVTNAAYWDDECYKLLSSNLISYYQCFKFYSKKIPEHVLFYNDNEFFIDLLKNNIFDYLEKLAYGNFKENFFSKEENVNLLINKFPNCPLEYINNYRIDYLYKMPKFLNVVLNSDDTTFLSRYIYSFTGESWTLENQKLYFNLIQEGKKYDSINKLLPFVKYKFSYIDGSNQYFYRKEYVSVDDNKILDDENIVFTIGEDIYNGKDLGNPKLNSFYKLIYETKSKSILYLARALMHDDLNNIDLLFNENGITDYFFEYLSYDPDYILFCIKNNIELIDRIKNPKNITYIKILVQFPMLPKYIVIDNDNIDRYIKNGKTTREFTEKLLNEKGYELLLILCENNFELEISSIEKYIVDKSKSIKKQNSKKDFIKYCIKRIDNINEDSIDKICELIIRIEDSNSIEIRKKSEKIIEEVLLCSDPLTKLNEIENIYSEDNIPEFGKRFAMYKLLYSKNKDLSKNSSPILLNSTDEEIDQIILYDLLNVSLNSFNVDLLNYIGELTNGQSLFDNIRFDKKNYEELTKEEKNTLNRYRKKIEFLAKYILKLNINSSNDDLETIYDIERNLKLKIKYPEDLPIIPFLDVIIDQMFGKFGISSYIKLYMHAHSSLILKTAMEEGRYLNSRPFEIKDGDFIKGVSSEYLGNILKNGSLCKEMLGEDATRDLTHLDTDLSIIRGNGKTIKDVLSSNIDASRYGDIKLILSREYMEKYSSVIETRDAKEDKEYSDSDKNKIEVFNSKYNDTHYCIRTGFPSTFIKAIVADRNLNKIKFEIVKNGFYIPIFNSENKLLFGYDEYIKLSKKRSGLKYYYDENYEISNNLESEEINEEVQNLNNNIKTASFKRNIIYKQLNKVFEKYFLGIKYSLDGSLSSGIVEIFDTGSTGRGTNVANDGDFDFILRLDREFISNEKLFDNFIKDIYEVFNKPYDGKIIRLTDVYLDGVDEPLKIEITPIVKTNKVIYSTDECIKDRLSTIKKLYPDKYDLVIANIVQAKKIFKENEIYKPKNARGAQGGLGGVGTETWILQHGGSLYDAAESFVSVALKCKDFNEFKEKYTIYDFGENHLFEEKNIYPYDNFVYNLDEKGYKRLIDVLIKYIEKNKNKKVI